MHFAFMNNLSTKQVRSVTEYIRNLSLFKVFRRRIRHYIFILLQSLMRIWCNFVLSYMSTFNMKVCMFQVEQR